MIHEHDTIAAPATAAGGALAVVRVSGNDALAVCDRIFRGRTLLSEAGGNTVHYGRIADGDRTLDDVLVSVFRAPHSYTGENSAEISCHGSSYIVSELLRLLQAAGARMAAPGEFTTRAFLAGKMDLSQAEAVADLIASSSRAAHALASTQMRGGYSEALGTLRDRLLQLASLLELELDFAEEEVEFADRSALRQTMERIAQEIDLLRESFSLGNALKEGVAVAIAGAPNAGKSTLLNRLLNEDRAMVSDIPGTTRDVIEECTLIDGVRFRFLDTAGIRSTNDRLEKMGIERTMTGIARAQIVIYLVDAASLDAKNRSRAPKPAASTFPDAAPASSVPGSSSPRIPTPEFTLRPEQHLLTVVNKIDTAPGLVLPDNVLALSAKRGEGLGRLRDALRAHVDTSALYHGDAVVSNSRHYEALTAAVESLRQALAALDSDLPSDLLSEEIRQVTYRLGTITGEITNDEILGTIFSKFCIGK